MKITHYDDHRPARAADYPPIGDQLDALWKLVATLPALPPETAAMLERIQAVKAAHPKAPDVE